MIVNWPYSEPMIYQLTFDFVLVNFFISWKWEKLKDMNKVLRAFVPYYYLTFRNISICPCYRQSRHFIILLTIHLFVLPSCRYILFIYFKLQKIWRHWKNSKESVPRRYIQNILLGRYCQCSSCAWGWGNKRFKRGKYI